ncbi:hypothetical protein DPMN_093661 [Dreissena polymorpha]|uniref:Secreted protein n=1 Tax=Dreissena polymorpha TaxID=45954 RepID=A0A9D4L3Y7_DREPO|nr:hypothetical protein DPMN_093661 [Dreissena polymorpha]
MFVYVLISSFIVATVATPSYDPRPGGCPDGWLVFKDSFTCLQMRPESTGPRPLTSVSLTTIHTLLRWRPEMNTCSSKIMPVDESKARMTFRPPSGWEALMPWWRVNGSGTPTSKW